MSDVLPDVLEPGLRIVFCGTAAGTASAKAGAYYAKPGNSFWQTLHATGLTPDLLSPADFRTLPTFGIGLTDICKVSYGADEELGTGGFDVDRLQASIAAVEPDRLAFNGKNAAQGALERPVEHGPQPEQIGGAEVWVLPSTSGRARRFWRLAPWQALADASRGIPQKECS